MSFETMGRKELLKIYGPAQGELMGFNLEELTDKELDMSRSFGSFGGSLRGIFYDQLEVDRAYREAERIDENRIPSYGPEFNNKLKAKIRARDNNTCQNPQCLGISLNICVHHIDYDKWNNDPSNLITVCKSCDSIANNNRSWWKQLYKTIMQRRGIC